MLRSVVAVGNIEQISKSPSRFTTNGQHMVASPIVAASKGTGMVWRTCKHEPKDAGEKGSFCLPYRHDRRLAKQGGFPGSA